LDTGKVDKFPHGRNTVLIFVSLKPRAPSNRKVYGWTGRVLPNELLGTAFQEGPHLADFEILIYMNRKRGLVHPMLVDVDLKEGYPDGRA
jgi:hypothetical protein